MRLLLGSMTRRRISSTGQTLLLVTRCYQEMIYKHFLVQMSKPAHGIDGKPDSLYKVFGNSFICPTRSGTTEIYIFGPAGAGIQNKICNIHLIDIVLQVQKYLEVQVFLVLQKYLEYQR